MIDVVDEHSRWRLDDELMHPNHFPAFVFGYPYVSGGIPAGGISAGLPGERIKAVVIVGVNDGKLEFCQRYEADIVAEVIPAIEQIHCANDTLQTVRNLFLNNRHNILQNKKS